MTRWLTAFLILSLPVLAIGAVWATPAEGLRAVSVLELFTSQGCSSCPTADALLRSYAARQDIVALSRSEHLGVPHT